MRIRDIKKTSPRLGKLIFSVVIFVVLVLICRALSRGTVPKEVEPVFRDQFKILGRMVPFNVTQNDSLKKRNAGFWQFVTAVPSSSPGGPPIRVKDRLELKNNGIIWEVKQYTMRLPSGDSTLFVHIMQAYLNPGGYYVKFPRVIGCDARIIHQVMIFNGHDTCYGKSSEDFIWRIARIGDTLRIQNGYYVPYGTTPLDTFFPAGAIDLVDKVTLGPCSRKQEFTGFLRAALAADLAKRTVDARRAQDVNDIIDGYYLPLFRADMADRYLVISGERADSLVAQFQLTWDGNVTGAKIARAGPRAKALAEPLLQEMTGWVFPKQQQATPSIDVTHTVRLTDPAATSR